MVQETVSLVFQDILDLIVIRSRQQIVNMDKLHIIFLEFANTVIQDIGVSQNVIKFVIVLILQIVMMAFMELVIVNSVTTTQHSMAKIVLHVYVKMEDVMVVLLEPAFVNTVTTIQNNMAIIVLHVFVKMENVMVVLVELVIVNSVQILETRLIGATIVFFRVYVRMENVFLVLMELENVSWELVPQDGRVRIVIHIRLYQKVQVPLELHKLQQLVY